MNTAEMWVKAQEDGKVYECINGYMAYSSKMGLVNKFDFDDPWGLEVWEHRKQYGIDDLMRAEWQEMTNVMTIEEAEQEFGIKIVRN